MLTCLQFIQSPTPSAPDGVLPVWLTSGPIPIFLTIIAGLIIIYVWMNFRINRVQTELHDLGLSYHEKERAILNDYRGGRLTEREYRREHERLVREMREESRKFTD